MYFPRLRPSYLCACNNKSTDTSQETSTDIPATSDKVYVPDVWVAINVGRWVASGLQCCCT